MINLESWHSSELKSEWIVVRLDFFPLPDHQIISACETTGECLLLIKGEQKNFNFGINGIRIVKRK